MEIERERVSPKVKFCIDASIMCLNKRGNWDLETLVSRIDTAGMSDDDRIRMAEYCQRLGKSLQELNSQIRGNA